MRLLMLVALLLPGGAGAATRVEPRDLIEVADFGPPVISPDGRQVAYRVEQASVERNTYDAFWYVQSLEPGALPRRIADGGVVLRDSAGTPLPATVMWSSDGRWVYYRALIDGRLDVWRASTDGAGARPITQDPADVRAFTLSRDGRRLRYSVGATREAVTAAEQAEYDQGVRIDGTVPIGQGLVRSGAVEGRLATQRYAGLWFDRAALLADVPDRWKALDLATGTLAEAEPEPVDGVPDEARIARRFPDAWKTAASVDGRRVAVLTRFGEKDGLQSPPNVRLSAATLDDEGPPVVCTHALCTGQAISAIQWRPGRDEVLFTVTDRLAGGAQSIFRWEVRTGAVHPVATAAGLLNGGREIGSRCGASASMLVCVRASANQPPRLEAIDIDRGAAHVLYDPNGALGHALAVSAPAVVMRWRDARGQVFTGQFYAARSSPGQPAPPLFVNYYLCSGFVRGGVGDEWPFASLAANGISALCINDTPYRLDPLSRYQDARSAVESAVRQLAGEHRIDPHRVGMGGLSFGSEVTLWVAMQTDLLSAASVSSPSVSSTYYLFGSLKGDLFAAGLKELWGLGALDQTPERWRLLSPEFNVDRIQAPVLFQMPEQEYLPALDYAAELIRRGRADMYVFPNEPHQKFQPRHKLAVYERNVDWFRFWLQGIEDPSPSKQAQYSYWREMRRQGKAMPAEDSASPRQR
ncbi:Atxe2 family lasso peptide isopeptidase [Pseudoxanthomonas winnipegensis]|jgi:dipeptidyl aminopeptidase/acylaminoacyl peptidase|uniref:Atxe2 family lasso peptide isopeptidase n=1 Tax=Pseudoxanthomonas winnipegensis TaxID=2480810 RepID=A0A4V2HCQ6_9GAMM|nr:Atxe2 family lasso peptide isopeptidase [Pseudoxanthomonas winnipegensis]TAA23310.1 Atxe2 family lasso peptide isopeptidase [Pseudoxanthomonas winnipegensis]